MALPNWSGSLSFTPPIPPPPAPPHSEPCDEHYWVMGTDACLVCGQSWAELYEIVSMEIHEDGSIVVETVPR